MHSDILYLRHLFRFGQFDIICFAETPAERGTKRSLVIRSLPTSPTSPPPETYIEQTFKEKV